MVDYNFDPVRSVGGERVLVVGRVAIGAVGAVGTKTGLGFAVTRSSQGVYAIALDKSAMAIMSARAWLAQPAASEALFAKAERTSTGMTVRCYASPWAGAAKEAGPYTLVAPAAGASNIHAQFTGDFNTGAGITQPDVPRNVQVVAGGACTVTVTGTSPSGSALSEAIACAGAATYVGAQAFATITNLAGNPGGVVTTTIQLAAAANTVFGVGPDVSSFNKLTANGVDEAFAASVVANGTFRPTTAPNGIADYMVWYSRTETAAASLTDPTSGDELHLEMWCRDSSLP